MVEYDRFVAKLSVAPRVFHLTEILNIYSKKSVDETFCEYSCQFSYRS